jgi:hypothetical protein
MKHLILPSAIIVILIVFFVIIERKKFNWYEDASVQTVQCEKSSNIKKISVFAPETESLIVVTSTAKTEFVKMKSVESKTVESEPMTASFTIEGAKPVTETKASELKHADTYLLAETKLSETNPAETKTETTRFVSEIEPANRRNASNESKSTEVRIADSSRFFPVAVPVITAEEAIIANEEALRFSTKEKSIPPVPRADADTNDINSVAEYKEEDEPAPMAVPVLTSEEAIKANKEALRFQRNNALAKTFQSFIHKIGLNNNRIHFIFSLLPLLFVIDILIFKRKKNKKNGKLIEYISLPRRVRILLSVSLLAFGILVFVPWSVYFGNSLQFPFIFQDFVNWNLRVLTISIIGSSVILLLIPPIISDYLIGIIAGLGFCVYVQAMFMNQYLESMNKGVEPNWSEHVVFGTINLIIWITLILSPVILRKVAPSYFFKIISMATGVILFLEVLATMSMVFSADQSVWLRSDEFFVDGSNQFQFSKKKNVVVFVFDALGSGFVKKCFEDYPETKELMKDFTWYIDARSNYGSTFLGLTCELTGTTLKNPANSFYEIFEKMWHSPSAESFYKQMKDAGYDSRFFMQMGKSGIGPEDYYHSYFSNVERNNITYIIDYNRIHFCLKVMSGFSFAPYFLKKHFFYAFDFADNIVQKEIYDIPSKNRGVPRANSDYLKKLMTSGISSEANKPTLSFHYLIGAHPPFRYDAQCNDIENPTSGDPIPATRSCFYILSKFISFLKDMGIYNNTAILVCSDHGGYGEKGEILSTPFDMTFMIKPFDENKSQITIDNSKVQSIDILPTILSLSCGYNADFKDFDGYPSFDVPKDRIRKIYNLGNIKDLPSPDPALNKTYGDMNSFIEYDFVDMKSFNMRAGSKSIVRQFPLVNVSHKDSLSHPGKDSK